MTAAEGEAAGRALDLRYRTVSGFLVAYSAQLAKGEIFVEAEAPWPPGTRASLRLHAPGAPPLELEATVSAVRTDALGPGQPAGMTLSLSPSIDAYGPVIDELAARYHRIRILLGTGEPAPRAIIGRYLRSILSCDLTEVSFEREGQESVSVKVAPEILADVSVNGAGTAPGTGQPIAGGAAVDGPIDLAVVDLDSSGPAGEELVAALRQDPATAEIPIIVLAQLERDRARGVGLGADEALTNPPLFGELRTAVIHGLSRARVSGA